MWLAEEPAGLQTLWPALGRSGAPATKLWTDAYLAAFSIAGGYRLATFDRGFLRFVDQGLDLLLLKTG